MKRIFLAIAILALGNVLVAQTTPLWMRYPAISPDGQTIVFSYKGDLYTVPSAGGTAVALTMHEAQDYYPVWHVSSFILRLEMSSCMISQKYSPQ